MQSESNRRSFLPFLSTFASAASLCPRIPLLLSTVILRTRPPSPTLATPALSQRTLKVEGRPWDETMQVVRQHYPILYFHLACTTGSLLTEEGEEERVVRGGRYSISPVLKASPSKLWRAGCKQEPVAEGLQKQSSSAAIMITTAAATLNARHKTHRLGQNRFQDALL